MLKRSIETAIKTYLDNNQDHKILFIWGPRRSGKTTLLKKFAKELAVPIFNFDLLSDRAKFQPDRALLQKIVAEHKVICIDEVQNYPESTLVLKILYDEFKVKIIATGSSELRHTSKDFDSLAGRFTQIFCLPLETSEIVEQQKIASYDRAAAYAQVMNFGQLFGLYPEVYLDKQTENHKIDLLENLLETYVLKDVIDIYNLKNAKLARDILTKIALQIGSEVSIREIANSLQANVATVSSYIEIFIKNYILIPLPSFKTNLRRAISENRKLYFYDLGIRNALVQDFRPLDLRPDKGGVFENFIIAEIVKRLKISNGKQNVYFYREYSGKEIDVVLEDYHKNYTCLEIKLHEKSVSDFFPLPHQLEIITQDNYATQLAKIIPEAQVSNR
jgi:hypothetical protein